MESRHLSNNRSYADKGDGVEAAAIQLSEEVVFGDLVWVKLQGFSFWPALVVDDNTVSQNNKPRNRSEGEVLVRLYGSYKYVYVDPVKCCSAFQNMLEEYNGRPRKILEKVLEQGLASFKSDRAKGRGSKSEGNLRINSPQGTKAKQKNKAAPRSEDNGNGIQKKKLKPENSSPSTSAENSQELNARRMKVMQGLGLIAPSGSPFCRNGRIYSS